MEKKPLSPLLFAVNLFAFLVLFRYPQNDRALLLQCILGITGGFTFYFTFEHITSRLNAMFKAVEYRSKQIKESTDAVSEKLDAILKEEKNITEEFDYIEKITEDFSKDMPKKLDEFSALITKNNNIFLKNVLARIANANENISAKIESAGRENLLKEEEMRNEISALNSLLKGIYEKLELFNEDFNGNIGSLTEHTIRISDNVYENIKPLIEEMSELKSSAEVISSLSEKQLYEIEKLSDFPNDAISEITKLFSIYSGKAASAANEFAAKTEAGFSELKESISSSAADFSKIFSVLENGFSNIKSSSSVIRDKTENIYEKTAEIENTIKNCNSENAKSFNAMLYEYGQAENDFKNDIKASITDISEQFKNNIAALTEKQNSFMELAESIGYKFKTEFMDMLEKFSSDFDSFNDGYTEILNSLSSEAASTADNTEELSSICRESFEMLNTSVSDILKDSISKIADVSQECCEGIEKVVSAQNEFADKISDIIYNLQSVCEDNLTDMTNDMSDYISDLKNEISEMRDNFMDNVMALSENQGEFTQSISDVIEQGMDNLTEKLDDFISRI